jgi:hypothetical protein
VISTLTRNHMRSNQRWSNNSRGTSGARPSTESDTEPCEGTGILGGFIARDSGSWLVSRTCFKQSTADALCHSDLAHHSRRLTKKVPPFCLLSIAKLITDT